MEISTGKPGLVLNKNDVTLSRVDWFRREERINMVNETYNIELLFYGSLSGSEHSR